MSLLPVDRRVAITFVLISMIAYSVLSIQFVPVDSQGSSNHVFFHGQSPRPDISIFGMTGAEFYYDGVDSNPPAGYGVTRDVTASISASSLASLGTSQCPVQVSSEMQAASFGFVLWTLPAPANTQVDGEIQIDVWMSSSDSPGFGAGYFFAIADVNPQNPHDICVLNYKINGGLGFNLGNSATLYSTSIFGGSFRISNHVFATGRTVAFLAGAGAQKSGWRFTVYFDGSSTPSGAYVPSTLLSQTTTSATTEIPEFPTTLNPSMIAALTILCFLLMEPAKNAKGGLEKALDYSK